MGKKKQDVTVDDEPKIFPLNSDYKKFITQLKDDIRRARVRAAVSVNRELVRLYWHIGKQILAKQQETDWGSGFIEATSKDLKQTFPETQGFSTRNLRRMRQFASLYPDFQIWPQAVANLPWGHISLLIQRVKVDVVRNWYAEQIVDQGWSRASLERAIKQDLYASQAISTNKTSNYKDTLPSPQSALAQDILQNPYNFDFLGLHDDAQEREIEHAAIEHIRKFLLALGKGFAFYGSQVPIEIADETYFIDMLFYHVKLRCYVVIEFKATKFKPEHIGQLNFYLSAVDDLMRHPDDKPSIGLLLCQSRNKVIAEYALRDISKPIGVSEYELTKAVPESIQSALPTIEEIESELGQDKDQPDQ